MTVPSSAERNDYTGAGSTATYAYGFRIVNNAHLLVTVADADGAETTLTKTTDYTVTGVGVKTGGNIVLVDADQAWLDTSGCLKTGYHLTVRHYVPLAQAYDIRNLGAFYPDTYEDAIDYLMVVSKQQQDEIDRCVKSGETVSGITPIFPAPEDGKSLVWSGTTGAMVNSDLKGEKGDTGAVGPQGPAGTDGTDGASFTNDGTINPTNLLDNGDFETDAVGGSAAPTGWTLSGAGASADTSSDVAKIGTKSAVVTRSGADAAIAQSVHATKGIAYWKGRTVTFGCWVYAIVADRAGLLIYDGVAGTVISSFHTGDTTWQYFTVTKTIAPNATELTVLCRVANGNTLAYFDGAMLVEGSSAFAFSPKPLDANNIILDVRTADPASPAAGQIWFRSDL